MTNMSWGLLGPESLDSGRRTRTLGLSPAVRFFNDRAVPGIGGVWFGKQLFLATLGVALKERGCSSGRQLQNIETANAVEALASWLALKSNGWNADPRVRGATKMRGKEISFAVARKRDFYVTQPMRMATVQALPALGLVSTNGARFNSFSCARYGHELIEAQMPGYHGEARKSSGQFEVLAKWLTGAPARALGGLSTTEPLTDAARQILQDRLLRGSEQETMHDKERRRAALDWVEERRTSSHTDFSWDNKPPMFIDAHWHDLHAGALLFGARDAAIVVLDQIEREMGNQTDQRLSLDAVLPACIIKEVRNLQSRAHAFLDLGHSDELANEFCRECVNDAVPTLLEKLVERDERVLKLRNRAIVPGPAFVGASKYETESNVVSPAQGSGAEAISTSAWPEGISFRIRNLFLLNADLRGLLKDWIDTVDVDASESAL